MTLHASKQKMDHIAGAINLASGKDGVAYCFFFFLPLTLLGIRRSSASCFACQISWLLWVQPIRLEGEEEELCCSQLDSWQQFVQ